MVVIIFYRKFCDRTGQSFEEGWVEEESDNAQSYNKMVHESFTNAGVSQEFFRSFINPP